MKSKTITSMTNPVVEPDGQRVAFTVNDTDGGSVRYEVSSDAVEFLIRNLEHLAVEAMKQREAIKPQAYRQDLPALQTYVDHFQVEDPGSKDLLLRGSRRGRPDIEIPLVRKEVERFLEMLQRGGRPDA